MTLDQHPFKTQTKILGVKVKDLPDDERAHYIKCVLCDRWIDVRDLHHVEEGE